VLLIVLIAVAGCSSPGGTPNYAETGFSGQAINVETGMPLADVHVVLQYTSAPSIFVFPILPHGESGGCHSFDYSVTGPDGLYKSSSTGRLTHRLVYRKGYEIVRAPGQIKGQLESVGSKEETRYVVSPRDPAITFGMHEGVYVTESAAQHAAGYDNTYLRPFTGTPTERLKYLSNIFFNADCMWSGANRKNIVPFLQVVYLEAKSLPVSAKDADFVRGMERTIESEKAAR
jgi:hypothetical protein